MDRRRQRGERAAQLGGEEWHGLALRGAQLAADPAAHCADLGGLAGRVEAGGLVRGGDRREGEIDPGRLARASGRGALGERGEVGGERRRQRRQRRAVLGAAPGGEGAPLARVRAARLGRRGRRGEAARGLEVERTEGSGRGED